MVTVTLRCQHCESRNIVRNGPAADGRQRYLCRDCSQRSREQPRTNAYSEEEREQILRGADGARRAMEPDFAPAVGALRAADVVILEVITDGRGVFAPLHPSLQL